MARFIGRTKSGRKFRPLPAPQIIDGEKWNMRDSGDSRTAYVDFPTQTMVVPMDETEIGNMIRAHETTHVAITPRKAKVPFGIAMRTLQAVEDARVYSAMGLAGIDRTASHWPNEDVERLATLAPTQPLTVAQSLLAVRGTGDEDKVRAVAPEEIQAICDAVMEETFQPFEREGKLPPFDATLKACQQVTERIKEMPSSESPSEGDEDKEMDGDDTFGGRPKKGEGKQATSSDDAFKPFDSDGLGDRDKPVDLSDAEREALSASLGDGAYEVPPYGRGSNPVLKFQILRPKLTVKLKPKKLEGIKRRAMDSGTLPRNLHRYATDNAIFSERVKGGTATVLIDVSGSMHLTPEQIQAMIEEVPSALVAIYSCSRGSGGLMVVVAEGGKRVEEFDWSWFKGGNMIDNAALKWLARQKGPRYWICDGYITGEGDGYLTPEAALDAVRTIHAAGIQRIPNVKTLLSEGFGKAKKSKRKDLAY